MPRRWPAACHGGQVVGRRGVGEAHVVVVDVVARVALGGEQRVGGDGPGRGRGAGGEADRDGGGGEGGRGGADGSGLAHEHLRGRDVPATLRPPTGGVESSFPRGPDA